MKNEHLNHKSRRDDSQLGIKNEELRIKNDDFNFSFFILFIRHDCIVTSELR
jgi:hypothetical protein